MGPDAELRGKHMNHPSVFSLRPVVSKSNLHISILAGMALALAMHPAAVLGQSNAPTATVGAQAAPTAGSEATPLEPGRALERTMRGREKHVYAIRAETGQFLHATVEQQGIDVALMLYAPDGKALGSMDSPNGTVGLEQISAVAEAPGLYRLEVASSDKDAPAGRYRVTVEALRSPSDRDRARIDAERMFFEAVQAAGQGSGDALRKAIEKYMASLPLWRTAGDGYEEALTLDSIGGIYSTLGDNRKALDYFNQALPLRRAAGDRPGEASTLSNIGSVYDDLGEKQKALQYYNQALPIQHAAGDRSGEAGTLNGIGAVYAELGDKQKALEYFNQVLPILRAVGDRSGEADALSNMGVVYRSLGQNQKALECYNQALPILHEAGNRSHEAAILNNIGLLYGYLGQEQKALEYYNRALPIRREVGDRDGVATTLNNIGGLYNDLGQKQKALEYYNQAFQMKRELGDRGGEAYTLSNIGGVYYDLGQKEKALEYYNQALPMRREVGDHEGEAVTLSNIGNVYSELGEKQKALDYYSQALSLDRTVGNRRSEARTLSDMGLAYADLGEKQKALDSYTQSLPLSRAVQDPLGEAATLARLMEYWRSQGSPDLAVLFGKQAIDCFQQMRRNIAGLEKETQQSFLKTKEDYYRDLADLLIAQGRLPEAQQVLDLLKQQEYSDYVRGEAAGTLSPLTLTPAEKQAEEDYQRSSAELVSLGEQWTELKKISSRTPEQEKRFQDLSEQLDQASKGLNDYYARLYVLFGKNTEANKQVADVKGDVAALKQTIAKMPKTVALYTMVASDHYRVIVITAGATVAREYAISEEDLNKKVAEFQQVLRDRTKDPKPMAEELYKILIGPVKADLDQAQAQTLVWSLDGVLRYIPLAALYDGKQYLVESYATVTITPASIAHLAEKPDVSHSECGGDGDFAAV